MRTWIPAVAVLLTACLFISSAEAKAAKSKKDKGVSGTISSVATDGGSMVLTTKGKKGAGGGQKTVTINASTTIEINGASGKASDLHSGMTVKVALSGDTAQSITAGKKHKKKKA